MFEGGLGEGEGAALEEDGGFAGGERVGLEEGALGLVREELVVLEAEVGQPAVLVREDVLDKWPQRVVRELVRTEVQVLRVVQLGEELQEELVKDLGLSLSKTQQIVREVELGEGRAVREDHTHGL